jgi:Tfp pilus assembly protein PilN
MFRSKEKQKDINLLPEAESSLNILRIRMLVTTITVGAVVLVLIISAVVFSLSLYEKNNQRNLANSLQKNLNQWGQITTKAQNVAVLKSKLVQVKGINTKNQIFIDTTKEIRDTIPAGVFLSQFTFDGQNLELSMTSKDPRELYQYVNTLNKDTFFSNPQIKALTKDSSGYRMVIDTSVKGKQ